MSILRTLKKYNFFKSPNHPDFQALEKLKTKSWISMKFFISIIGLGFLLSIILHFNQPSFTFIWTLLIASLGISFFMSFCGIVFYDSRRESKFISMCSEFKDYYTDKNNLPLFLKQLKEKLNMGQSVIDNLEEQCLMLLKENKKEDFVELILPYMTMVHNFEEKKNNQPVNIEVIQEKIETRPQKYLYAK